jgi:predicted transglutaminase-like cysteine proteinase
MWGIIKVGVRHCCKSVKLMLAAVLLATTLGNPGPLPDDIVQAQTVSGMPLVWQPLWLGGRANPTTGWLQFCRKWPAECWVDPSEPERIILSVELWETIVSVNHTVNAAIKAMPDRQHWGVADRWDYPDDGIGDCEDIQLLKRKLLVEAGLPRRALRMTVVFDEVGEGHAVLMALTDRGEFILDNKRAAVLPWNQTGYTYLKREGSDGLAWASLVGRLMPVTADVAADLREKAASSAPVTSASDMVPAVLGDTFSGTL